MGDLGLPVDEHQARRLAALEKECGARYLGWGRDLDGFFVDVLSPHATGESVAELREQVRRFHGAGLHEAIGRARRANGGAVGDERP